MFKGEHKAPNYVRDKLGQVPVIDDNGVVVFENRGIIRYLEAEYTDQQPQLAPSSSNLAKFEQAAPVELTNFDPFAGKVQFEKLTKPHLGLESNNKLVDELEHSLADLFRISYAEGPVEVGYGALFDEKKRPNVARWFKAISGRDSEAWAKVKEEGIQTTLSD